MAKKTRKTGSKHIGRKIGKWLLYIILGFFCFTVLQVTATKWINPSLTYLMVKRKVEARKEGKTLELKRDWVSLDEISKEMPRAVIASEDNLFMEHNGFSKKGIEKAIKEKQTKGKVKHGGSTISQQTAKNVFTTGNRNYVRKAFEVYYTFLIEKIWGKRRIMEVYLNVIETGDGVFGVEAASQTYFHHSAKRLTRSEAALIAVCLPNPRKFKVNHPSGYIYGRQSKIVHVMGQLGHYGKVE